MAAGSARPLRYGQDSLCAQRAVGEGGPCLRVKSATNECCKSFDAFISFRACGRRLRSCRMPCLSRLSLADCHFHTECTVHVGQ